MSWLKLENLFNFQKTAFDFEHNAALNKLAISTSIKIMGSRPEVNVFILQMTSANEQKWIKRKGNHPTVFNEFGPYAWCNRKQGTLEQQKEAQMEAYAELIHYVAKVYSLSLVLLNHLYF